MPDAHGGAVRAGAAGLLLLLATAVIGPPLAGDPFAPDLDHRLHPPSAAHALGQDALGRDVLARLLGGARISLVVGVATVAVSLLIGVGIGALAALRGGWVDELASRAIDVLLAFPGLLLAIALAAVLGPSVGNVVVALSVLGWTGYARVTRAELTALGRREFVQAAVALGASPLRLLIHHLLPHTLPTLLVQATFGMSGAIVAEASLSFLGLGAPPPASSWGGMLDEGRAFLLVAPHLTLAPGAALALTILCLQLLGDGLRDRFDVRDAGQRWQRGQ